MYTAVDHNGNTIMWTIIILHLSLSELSGFENLSENKLANQISDIDPSVPANKAVDGIISKGWPNMAVTKFHTHVWWYVDLGIPRNIYNITIYYREEPGEETKYRTRFAGFSLYIANENYTTKGGYECDVDSTYPPTTFPIVCMHVGRYVTIYNQRPTAELEIGAILELGEVQVFGCPNATLYGTNCNIPCSDKCRNSWCNIINGSCFSCSEGYYGMDCIPCRAGNYGENCMFECSPNCVDPLSCDSANGNCNGGCAPGWKGNRCVQSCEDGKYGQNCINDCGNCLVGYSCNKVNGSCTTCNPGYYPPFCTTKCITGSYGQDCRQICSWNCKNNDTCYFSNGHCNQGCADGWTNSFCSATCPTGYYGGKCQSICSVNCKNGPVCDHVTGACDQGCKAGFYGPRCFESCSVNCKDSANCNQTDGVCINGCKNDYYGSKCSMRCSGHCKEFTFCDDKTGNCIFGCASGWKKENCTKECEPGEYGENCAYSCGSCVNGTTCNPVSGHCESGCGPGYTGLYCKQACGHGFYGQNCYKNCSGNCLNFETCNVETGTCDKGCIAGYAGSMCDEACEDGTYGQNCQLTCGYCVGREVCNKESGDCKDCIMGYEPPLCTSALHNLPFGVGIAVGVGIVTALIILSAIGWLIFRRLRNVNNTRASQPIKTKGTDAAYDNKDPYHVSNTDFHNYQELGDLSTDLRQYEEIKTQ